MRASGGDAPPLRRSKRILARQPSAEEFIFGRIDEEIPDAVADDMETDINTLIEEELIRYGTAAPQPASTDPCLWWGAHASELPNLSGIAMWMLSIPPSSAALEHIFPRPVSSSRLAGPG